MSVRNRASMVGYGNQRSTGTLSFLRWLLGIIGLGIVSFVIGFFVIAPMIPSGHLADAESRAGTPTGMADNQSAASHAATTPARQQNTLLTAPSRPALSRPARPLPGPSIDPAGDNATQPPGQPENATQGVTQQAPSENKDPSGNVPAVAPATGVAGANDTPPAPRHRRRRRHSHDQDTVQPPASPDGETPAAKPDTPTDQTQSAPGSAPDTQRAGEGASPTSPGAGPYRVQLGVFSTREAAEQEAQRVKDKGFRASVHTYTQDGRTLYRVQNGVFKDRARAETARQRLGDSGLDATLSNP